MWREKYQKLMEERAQEWERTVKLPVEQDDVAIAKLLRSKFLPQIRLGIPASKRPRLWFLLSNALAEQRRSPADYQQLTVIMSDILSQQRPVVSGSPNSPLSPRELRLLPVAVTPVVAGPSSRWSSDSAISAPHLISSSSSLFRESVRYIEKDVDRTFSNHPKFQGPHGLESLKRCLSVFSLMHTDIGYCQSMNFLAGLLLLFLKEEEAYWMLHSIITQLVPADYYVAGLVGVQTDSAVLKQVFFMSWECLPLISALLFLRSFFFADSVKFLWHCLFDCLCD